jgi:hypothetical protein
MKKTKNQAVTIVALTTVLNALALVSVFGSSNVSVFATGLNNPRGLKYGPDGYLYVAEGGIGGSNSTEGCCEQVVPPVGPYTGSITGSRISKINANGVVTMAVDNLPSSQTTPQTGSLISGQTVPAFFMGSRGRAL